MADPQKHLFDNVNMDWNLSHDDGSTDFSDDETIIEDRVKTAKIGRFVFICSMIIIFCRAVR